MRTDAPAPATTPSGLVIRPYAGEADHDTIVRLRNAEWAADGVRSRTSRAFVDPWLRHASEGFDPRRDLHVAEVGGHPAAVGWSEWTDPTDGVREYWTRGCVDPDFRRRGVGEALLRHTVDRVRRLAAGHETERPKVLGLGTSEHNIGAARLAERHGYQPVRWFFDMERPLAGELPVAPSLPEGIDVRPVGPEDGSAIWQADHDAFLDHWGGHDASEANYRRWVESPEFDPSLFVVAYDGSEIAAAVLNTIDPDENEQLGVRRGWLDSVFTRRAWRRRGLARALIVRSLHLLRERGMEVAVLGVDAENPSGALGLYESAGFAVTERMTAWRRPLEPGR